MINDYELGILSAKMDVARNRGNKRPKKLKCRPGYEQRGAVCQKKRPKKIKISKNHPVIKAAIGVAVGSAMVGAGVGIGKITMSRLAQSSMNEGLKELEKRTKKKVPAIVRKEVAAVVSDVEKAYDKMQGKEPQPSKFRQITKQVLIEATAGAVGSAVGSVSYLAGALGGAGAGRALKKEIKTNLAISGVTGTVFGSVAHLKAKQKARKFLEEKYGPGIRDPKARKEWQKFNDRVDFALNLGSGIFSTYKAYKNLAQAEEASKKETREHNKKAQEKGNYSVAEEVTLEKNWHKTLGVDPNASTEEIAQAYRQAAKKAHPDLGGKREDMEKLSEAYAFYKNRVKK